MCFTSTTTTTTTRLTQAHFEADSLALCNQCKCSAASAHFILLPKSIEKTASKDLHISSMSIELERARARKAFLNGAAIKERLCNNLELLLMLLLLVLVCPLLVLQTRRLLRSDKCSAPKNKKHEVSELTHSLTCSFASCSASPTPDANFFATTQYLLELKNRLIPHWKKAAAAALLEAKINVRQ